MLAVSSFHMVGVWFLKNNFGMCVRFCYLYLSGNWELGDAATGLTYSLNFYQFPGPTALLCFYMFTIPNH